MCKICKKEYDNNTDEIFCYNFHNENEEINLKYKDFDYCKEIKELPIELENLRFLYCDETNIQSIPLYKKLEKITCDWKFVNYYDCGNRNYYGVLDEKYIIKYIDEGDLNWPNFYYAFILCSYENTQKVLKLKKLWREYTRKRKKLINKIF